MKTFRHIKLTAILATIGLISDYCQISEHFKDNKTMKEILSNLTIGNWSSVIFSVIAIVMFFKIEKLQNKNANEIDKNANEINEYLKSNYRIFVNSRQSDDGVYSTGSNDWIEKIKYNFSKEQIIKLIKIIPFNNNDIAELIKNNTITPNDLENEHN